MNHPRSRTSILTIILFISLLHILFCFHLPGWGEEKEIDKSKTKITEISRENQGNSRVELLAQNKANPLT
jgi:hypothetical protein